MYQLPEYHFLLGEVISAMEGNETDALTAYRNAIHLEAQEPVIEHHCKLRLTSPEAYPSSNMSYVLPTYTS
jgi:hypothetical protein